MTAGVTETVNLRVRVEDDASGEIREITAQYSRFEREVNGTNRAMREQNAVAGQLRNAFRLLGVAAAGFVAIRLGRNLIEFVDSSREATVAAFDLANRLGTTTDSISALQFAAEQNGIAVEQVAQGLTALSRRAAAVPQNFERWGIATRDVNGNLVDNEELLRRVADRIQRARTRATQLAIADETLSEAGRRLVPILADGAAGLSEWRREAERVGAVIQQETAARVKELDDRLTDLGAVTQQTSRELLAELAPALTAIVINIRTAVQEFARFNAEASISDTLLEGFRTLGEVILPTVISTSASVLQAFILLRGVLAAAGSVVLFAAEGWVLLGQTIFEVGALLPGVGERSQSLSNELLRTAASVRALREEFARSAREDTGADIDLIGNAADRAALSVANLTRRIRENAATIAEGPGAQPGRPDNPGGDDTRVDPAEQQRQLAEARRLLLETSSRSLGAFFDENQRRLDFELQTIEAVAAREEELANQRVQISQRAGNALGQTFGEIISGQQSVEDGLASLGRVAAQEAAKFIALEAAKAAAAAFSSQAGIPIVGPILGAVAAAAVFAAVSAFSGLFHEGGIVGPNGRIRLPPDLARPLGPDERFARVQVGETIIPAGASGGGGGGGSTVNNFAITLQSLQNPGRAAFARTVETDLIPGIRDAVERGSSLSPRNIRGRFLR